MRHAKIVCTLGPACKGYDNIRRLIEAGMDVARLNFSHGDHQTHRQNLEDVRRAARDAGKVVAVLADLSGPKIRIGDLPGGQVELKPGETIAFTTVPDVGEPLRVSVNYRDLPAEASKGSIIFADDGVLQFTVISVTDTEIVCRAVNGGILKSRKGLNVPHGGRNIPALTAKDRVDLDFGKEIGVDFFALSFVRRAADVLEAKSLAGEIPVIAKIEKPQALESLEEIAAVADGIMVARGDLGVELGAEKVPLAQKRMIKEMNRRAKPAIVATQMLESMVQHPRPTRAEVSDIANAVLDGADALMLSAESAAGKYPVESVAQMARIIAEVEGSAIRAGMLHSPAKIESPSFEQAIAHAAAQAAIGLDLAAVVVYSAKGRSPALVSAFRPAANIFGVSDNDAVLRRMALNWGVIPIEVRLIEREELALRQVESKLLGSGLAAPGDQVAVVFGLEFCKPPGSTMMKLWTITDGSAGTDACSIP